MKLLTLILSIYVLLMAVVPCCAFDKCSADQEMSTGNHKDPEGMCSPFFSCHSCSVPVLLEKPLQITLIVSTSKPHYNGFQLPSLRHISYACWNPPRA